MAERRVSGGFDFATSRGCARGSFVGLGGVRREFGSGSPGVRKAHSCEKWCVFLKRGVFFLVL